MNPITPAVLKTAPATIARPLVNRIYAIRTDLDRATSMCREFLQVIPASAAKAERARKKAKPASNGDLIRHKEAVELLCGRGVLDRCVRAGWFKAIVQKKRMTLYRRVDILASVAKIEAGDLP